MKETRRGHRKKNKFGARKLISFDSGKGRQRSTCGIGVLTSTDHRVMGPEAGLPQSMGSVGRGKCRPIFWTFAVNRRGSPGWQLEEDASQGRGKIFSVRVEARWPWREGSTKKQLFKKRKGERR